MCSLQCHFNTWLTHLRNAYGISDLFEERALLLCRLGRHEVALAIYAHVMKEPEMAEE